MATLDVTQKSRIYHTLSELNTAFAAIVGHCDTLQQTGLFKSKPAKLFASFTQELQAEINQEFLEDLHQLELDDWSHHTAKPARNGKSILAVLTTFLFMRKNAGKNWPNSARNASGQGFREDNPPKTAGCLLREA